MFLRIWFDILSDKYFSRDRVVPGSGAVRLGEAPAGGPNPTGRGALRLPGRSGKSKFSDELLLLFTRNKIVLFVFKPFNHKRQCLIVLVLIWYDIDDAVGPARRRVPRVVQPRELHRPRPPPPRQLPAGADRLPRGVRVPGADRVPGLAVRAGGCEAALPPGNSHLSNLLPTDQPTFNRLAR